MHIHYPDVKNHPNKPFHCMFCKKEIRVTNIATEQYLNKATKAFTTITFFLTVPLLRIHHHLPRVYCESLAVNLLIQNFAYLAVFSLAVLLWLAYVRIRYDFEEIGYNEKSYNTERNEPRFIPRFTIKNLISLFVFAPDYKTENCILYSKNGFKLKPRGLSYQQYRCNCSIFDFILGEVIAVNIAVICHHAKFGLFTLPLYLVFLIGILFYITISFLYLKYRFAFIVDNDEK